MELNEALEMLFQFAPIENVEEATICVHAIEREFEKVKEDRAKEREKYAKQSEILRILKKHIFWFEEPFNETIELAIEKKEKEEDYKAIAEWLEEK